MSETHTSIPDHCESEFYVIRVKGQLEARWADWLGGLSFTHERDGTTTLAGPLADQSALHGVFNVIRDLGLPIISVNCVSGFEKG
jgi:hypothetical protein